MYTQAEDPLENTPVVCQMLRSRNKTTSPGLQTTVMSFFFFCVTSSNTTLYAGLLFLFVSIL